MTDPSESANAPKRSVIIGAGPAGLTCASELLSRTDIVPLVLEKSQYMGGIARTVNYKGNRIDIGPHRFFSKSDRVMNWWLSRMPMQAVDQSQQTIKYQGKQRDVEGTDQGPNPEDVDQVMLLLQRRTRIYYLRRFFSYPINLSAGTVLNLGLWRTFQIGLSYLKSVWFPIRPEENLEQFFINRFGAKLYLTFFKSYTEKVWGVPCDQISAEWGAQRVKGLSITRAVVHALTKPFRSKDVTQKKTETSLIEQFLFPKYGSGQMWEHVAGEVTSAGGQVLTHQNVSKIHVKNKKVVAVDAVDQNGESKTYQGDYFFSTMPIKELIRAMDCDVPESIRQISDGLVYRDFIIVGLLLNQLKIKESSPTGSKLMRDSWIYIQESDVLLGRVQIYNNWGSYMLKDPSKVWLGLEYFCNDTDDLWSQSEQELIALGTAELAKIGIIDADEVLDATVIKMPKTYPAYFGTYDRFDELRAWIDEIENLYLLGRNGMHRYNNQDHAMLTAMTAVDNLAAGRTDKSNIWEVNTEQDYHEQKNES